ncbi:MAG: putative O-methyltransferase YrrM [Halieaceae bacterium]|jgi:predicted O-methyltransferase YrrM
MSKFKIAIDYVRHQMSAYNRHGIHSPFVYDFLEQVVYKDTYSKELQEFKVLRTHLLSDTRKINITDLGAGSTINASKTRTIKDIAKNSSKKSKYGRLFYRMIQYFDIERVIELGTSVGLSTIYFAKAIPEKTVITIEGCPNTLHIAKENFANLNLSNIETVEGDFKETLAAILEKPSVYATLIFFDGNHQEQATLEYFNTALKSKTEQSIFIFDDIHWSKGMTNAWNKIKGHPETVVTLDLFFLGIVFFDSRLTAQDFKIKF